jgi:uncharacterized protein involved in exopolysaccharide biosynthesis
VPGLESRAQPDEAPQPPGWRSWVTVLLAGLLIVLLLVIAASACYTSTLTGYCVASVAAVLALVLLLRVRKAGRSQGFLGPFLLVFLLAFGVAAGITALLPKSYIGFARIKIIPNAAESQGTNGAPRLSGAYDPYLVETELQVLQSEKILGPVIQALDLNRRWGKRFAGGQELKPAETLLLLQRGLDIQPVRNASVITIRVYADEPGEAAELANQIAQVYSNQDNLAPFRVEILDRAVPAHRPSRPNIGLNLAIGVLLGLVLGAVAGAVRVACRASEKRG